MNTTNESDIRARRSWRATWLALLKYIIPPFITLALCWILFTGVDIRQMWTIITTQCNFWWIAVGLVISIFSHIFRALRWQIQLKALGITPPLFIIILSIFGTYAVNLVLPRLGEFWRTGYIAERQNASFTEVFGSMICDRLADMITVLTLLVVTLVLARQQIISYLSQDTSFYEHIVSFLTSPFFWVAIIISIFIIILIFKKFPKSKPVKLISELAKGVWDGIIVIIRMKGKGAWLIYSFLIWFAYFIELYVAFLAFPATETVLARHGIIVVLVCFVLSSLALAVPSNGGFGPYQWALIFGLGMYAANIPELTVAYASSFANLVLGANTVMLILLGIFTFIYIAVDKRKLNSSVNHGT